MGNNQFLGLGNASADPERESVVVGKNMTLTGLVFSTRSNPITTASGTVYISTDCGTTFTPTTLTATVTSPACFAIAFGSIPVTVGTLITVGIDTGGGAFNEGAAATILFTIP